MVDADIWGRFRVTKTIIPAAQEHFLASSARCDTHLFGGLGLKRMGSDHRSLQILGHPPMLEEIGLGALGRSPGSANTVAQGVLCLCLRVQSL